MTERIEEAEVVDGLPVLVEESELAPPVPAGEIAVVGRTQVAALAATGFVAGAATMALAHRRSVKKAIGRRSTQRRLPFGDVLASNSFLVDVHLLKRD